VRDFEQDPPRADEELLAWLLDERTRRRHGREELEADPQVRSRLEGLEGFLEDCRAELRAEEAAPVERMARLEREVLARTTREDVSWRGDLRLMGGFLRQRLSTSVVLRVVAASLLVHIAALPVLAYYTWVAPAPERRLVFDVREFPSELPYRESEQEPEPVPEAPELPELPEATSTAGSAAELFHERLVAQGLIDLDGGSHGPPPETVVWGDELGLVLRCEQLLDERDADGAEGRPEHLAFALGQLRSKLDELGAAEERAAWRVLAASAWLRAGSAGVAPRDTELSGRCDAWLRAAGHDAAPLEAESWRELFHRAEGELDGE